MKEFEYIDKMVNAVKDKMPLYEAKLLMNYCKARVEFDHNKRTTAEFPMNNKNKKLLDFRVKEWTEDDERKYQELLKQPNRKPTTKEQFELGAVSPYPPLGAFLEREQNTQEKDVLRDRNDIMLVHDIEMKRIRAKLIADLTIELVKKSNIPVDTAEMARVARETAYEALKNIE